MSRLRWKDPVVEVPFTAFQSIQTEKERHAAKRDEEYSKHTLIKLSKKEKKSQKESKKFFSRSSKKVDTEKVRNFCQISQKSGKITISFIHRKPTKPNRQKCRRRKRRSSYFDSWPNPKSFSRETATETAAGAAMPCNL
jgi:hypothetical protein